MTDDLMRALHRLAERGDPVGVEAMVERIDTELGDGSTARRPVRHRSGIGRRRPLLVAGALTVAIAIAVAGLALLSGTQDREARVGTIALTPERLAVGRRVALAVPGQDLTLLAAARTSLWAAGAAGDHGTSTLFRLDPVSGAVRSRVTLPGDAISLAAGFRSLWVVVAATPSGSGSVVRVDDRSGRVRATLDLATPARVATGAGAVWVTDPQRGELDRIDPGADRIDGTLAVPGATAVAVAAGRVWVADPTGGSVVSIDPESRQVVTTLRGFDHPDALVASGTALWAVSSRAGELVQIDTANPRLIPPVRLSSPLAGVTAAGRGALWLTFGAGTDSQLGLIRDGQLQISPAPGVRGIRAAALAATGDGLWTLEPRSSTLIRLEAR